MTTNKAQLTYTYLLLGCMALSLMGCARHHAESVTGVPRVVNTAADLAGDEVLVIGSIEVVPPIQSVEQNSLDEQDRNMAALIFDKELRRIWKSPWGQYEEGLPVPMGQLFVVALPRALNFYIGAMLPMRVFKRPPTRRVIVELPGGFPINMQQHGRYLYIGKIRYTRDDFFNIVKVDIIDDTENASTQFSKMFGPSAVLKKAVIDNHME